MIVVSIPRFALCAAEDKLRKAIPSRLLSSLRSYDGHSGRVVKRGIS
jgi:hypothetical protein